MAIPVKEKMPKPKRKKGRPLREVKPWEYPMVEKLGRYGMPIDFICDLLGCGTSTFYKMARADEEFMKCWKRGKANMVKATLSSLNRNINNTDQRAIEFYLTMQAGFNNSQRQEAENDLPEFVD